MFDPAAACCPLSGPTPTSQRVTPLSEEVTGDPRRVRTRPPVTLNNFRYLLI